MAPYVVIALTVIGAGLRILALDSKGLWLDEAFSIWLGNQSLPDLYAWLLKIDQHPPLYYALLHVWMRLFGDGASAVRLLSALFGALTIPVMFLLGRRLLGAPGGLIAAAILTVAPFHIRFAQETRMYTLLTLNAALALYFLARLLTEPQAATDPIGSGFIRRAGARRPGLSTATADLSWLGLIIFTVATMLSHNTAVLFPLSTNLFVLGFIAWRWRFGAPIQAGASSPYPVQLSPPSARNWLTSQAAVLLLWSPWLPAFAIQARGVDREFWIQTPTLATIAITTGNFFSAHFPLNVALMVPIIIGFAGILVLGAVYLHRRPALLALLITLCVTPFVGELLISLRRPIFYDRTLIYITLPLYLLMAAGVLQLRFKALIATALVAIIAANGVSLHNYYTNFEKEQWREAAAYVAGAARDGDLLIFNATWVQIPFDYYFRDASGPKVEERGAPVDLFDRGVLEPKMAQSDAPRLRELIRGRERVWLIYSHNWYTDPQNIVPDVLGAELTLLERHPFAGLDVRLYADSSP